MGCLLNQPLGPFCGPKGLTFRRIGQASIRYLVILEAQSTDMLES